MNHDCIYNKWSCQQTSAPIQQQMPTQRLLKSYLSDCGPLDIGARGWVGTKYQQPSQCPASSAKPLAVAVAVVAVFDSAGKASGYRLRRTTLEERPADAGKGTAARTAAAAGRGTAAVVGTGTAAAAGRGTAAAAGTSAGKSLPLPAATEGGGVEFRCQLQPQPLRKSSSGAEVGVPHPHWGEEVAQCLLWWRCRRGHGTAVPEGPGEAAADAA